MWRYHHRSNGSGLIVSKFLILFVFLASSLANASSLRYFGNGTNDIDRVKIRIDDPANNAPGPPADIGASDFTIELWLKAASGNNAGAVSCGFNYSWINGNVVVDRDRFNQGRTFGVSLGAGRVAFAVQNASNESRTLCGSTDLRDGAWHHVAVQRRRSDGFMSVYVDGALEASGDGPDGDVSYPDNGVPTNDCGGPCTGSDPFLVIGAEKHDAAPQYPSFSGWVDELRLSSSLRYSANFAPAQQAFVADANTAALYHFDEGSGDVINDSSSAGQSPGERRFGGNPAGPAWSADTPFSGGGGAGTLRLSSAAYSVAEDSGTATITVNRTGGASGQVSVDFATSDGTATAGADYQAAMGTLSWPDLDSTNKSFSVAITDDFDNEGDETIDIALSNVSGNAVLGSPTAAVLTISDNDVPNAGSVGLSSSGYSTGEGTAATITLTRIGGSDGVASVDYATADGSATAGADYQPALGTVNWPDGDSANKTFSVTVNDDSELEGDETVSISLQNVTGAAAGSPLTAVLTIVDDEVAAQGSAQFAANAYTVNENIATVAIVVTREGGTDGAVTVDYATQSASAVSGTDFQAANGVLSWTDGDGTQKTVNVTIIDDAGDENNETFTVSLSNPTGGLQLGNFDTTTVTVVDNDDAPPPPPPSRGGGGGSTGFFFLLSILAGTFIRMHRRFRSAITL
ncbi:MAG TPA: Calx-beta domain-containing protein [Woeseiaceae bacterium]|nr:Calx-beta domain-containing protein [Woeseiaceae bacterium]